MAGVQVESGSALANAIQSAIQPKLIENGWVAEENDTTMSEYVTVMVCDGKPVQEITAELGGDLLGTTPDDPAVAEFVNWLFEQVRLLSAPQQPPADDAVQMQQAEASAEEMASAQDSQMDDAVAADGVPSGPKAMRNGAIPGAGRGRDRRMLGQLNNHMTRDQNLPDSLRRIKGAAGGQQGRINSHASRDPPRGPKGQNLANGVQRMMNGAGRGGRGGAMNGVGQMPQANMMNPSDPQAQMFMQMMEMQAAMMQQMMEGGGQMPNFNQANGHSKSLFDRVDKRQGGNFKGRQSSRPNGSQGDDGASGMDVDSKKEPFDQVCRFNTNCTNPNCPYAHQSPAAPPGQTMDLTDTCSFGAACENRKCAGRHPSPAQRSQHLKQEVDCKFFPNCTNPSCPFKHPDMPLCRNGADCAVPNCKFTHSKIMCRYTPCTKPFCPFKHVEGQRGVFKDKVWTSDGVPDLEGEDGGTSNRFSSLVDDQGQPEELILPGQEEMAADANALQHESQLAS